MKGNVDIQRLLVYWHFIAYYRIFFRLYLIANALHSQLNWSLCAAKNDALVKITLPKDNTQILTSQYQLYLPSEEALLEEIRDVLDLAEGGAADE